MYRFTIISGIIAAHINQAQHTRSNEKSCHIATNVNTTQIFHIFVLDPPHGMKIYLINHWLKPRCHDRQNPSKQWLFNRHRFIFSGESIPNLILNEKNINIPSNKAADLANLQIVRNFNQINTKFIKDKNKLSEALYSDQYI